MTDPTNAANAAPSPSNPPAPAPTSPPTSPSRRRAYRSYALIGIGVLTSLVSLAATRRTPPPQPPAVAQVQKRIVQTTVPVVAAAPAARPRIEIVFALDTTSSMTGLIEGAKRKIWSIASFVARGQPAPDLRVGLVAYRDLGDEYVTRIHDLDDDLDRVYARLRRLRADGGGDGPEHVARALDESVNKIGWSSSPDALKLIYLVGDAPPHDDYQDGYDIGRATRAAVKAGIAIHTIRCGQDGETERVWRTIARAGQGQFMTVQQDGGMRDEATPFDDELARLHDRLGETAIGYGAEAERAYEARRMATAAPMPVKLERARFMAAKGRAVGGAGDLVHDVASGTVSLGGLAPAAMPAELRGLSPAAQRALVAGKQKEREVINRRIEELSVKRARHLESAPLGARTDGFDEVAKKSLRHSVSNKPSLGFKL